MQVDRSLKRNHLAGIPSSWTEHIEFSFWIVDRLNPKVIVDLGVDYGYSSYCFAMAGSAQVYAIDKFQGDKSYNFRNTYDYVVEKKKLMELDNLNIVVGEFDDVVVDWDKKIDILHIDGDHMYESVKNDYDKWSPFVKKTGVILFHDTNTHRKDFGVERFFNELEMYKTNFMCNQGLGVASKSKSLIEEIKSTFSL